jgi:hypothetical protein
MSTQKAFSVTLTKPGVRDYGVWAGKTGGESTRDVTDYYPGAQRPAIKYTDTPTTSDIVIRKREADLTDAAWRDLYADLDSDAEYVCVVQRMTAGGGNAGAPRSYRGLVVGVTPSDVDAGSADVAEVQVTLAVFGLPTIAS